MLRHNRITHDQCNSLISLTANYSYALGKGTAKMKFTQLHIELPVVQNLQTTIRGAAEFFNTINHDDIDFLRHMVEEIKDDEKPHEVAEWTKTIDILTAYAANKDFIVGAGSNADYHGIIVEDNVGPCQDDNCNGHRIQVRWQDGRTTYPCSESVIKVKDHLFQLV